MRLICNQPVIQDQKKREEESEKRKILISNVCVWCFESKNNTYSMVYNRLSKFQKKNKPIMQPICEAMDKSMCVAVKICLFCIISSSTNINKANMYQQLDDRKRTSYVTLLPTCSLLAVHIWKWKPTID
jgi:hypothetical protein